MNSESKPEINVAERTVPRGGEPQELDERLGRPHAVHRFRKGFQTVFEPFP